jgi:hypothetical protein
MLAVETIGQIRRERFIQDDPGDRAGSEGVAQHRPQAAGSGEMSFEYERNVQPRPKLGRWTAELDELLSGKPSGGPLGNAE